MGGRKSMEKTEEKLNLFKEMISTCHQLLLCTYDHDFFRLGNETEEERTAEELLFISLPDANLLEEVSSGTTPVLFTSRFSMMWLLCPEYEGGSLKLIHVLGPFFMDDISARAVSAGLAEAGATFALRQKAENLISRLPVLSWGRIQEYALMLHYLITEEKIRQSDLRFFSDSSSETGSSQEQPANDTHGTYLAEQEMLRMVREGDLELIRHIDRIAVTGSIGQLAETGDTLRQMKNSVQVCATLFSRAAIEGGLSPETAYTLCDMYFQSVEKAGSLSELTGISQTMHQDFVRRVHAVRTQQLSKTIESACSYMERHLEDELSIASLAAYAGYTEYYFSKKFKRETGMSVAGYLRQKRLEKAAILLRSTDLDIQQIAIRMQFCSQSYFTDNFRRHYGVSPSQYRKDGLLCSESYATH